jgi:hypothetical protein
MIFRKLTEEQAKVYRSWARQKYTLFTPIDGCWHPIVQEECVKMNTEAATFALLSSPWWMSSLLNF